MPMEIVMPPSPPPLRTVLLLLDETKSHNYCNEQLISELAGKYKLILITNKQDSPYRKHYQHYYCRNFNHKLYFSRYKQILASHDIDLVLLDCLLRKRLINYFEERQKPVFGLMTKHNIPKAKCSSLFRVFFAISWLIVASKEAYRALLFHTSITIKPRRLSVASAKKLTEILPLCYQKAKRANAKEILQAQKLAKIKQPKLYCWHCKASLWDKIADYWGLTAEQNAKNYIRRWQTGMEPRRPIIGFHPGIYGEENRLDWLEQDPYLHYIEHNKPDGLWKWPVITQYKPASKAAKSLKVGLHIHAYFTHAFAAILARIYKNSIWPDLFISVKNNADKELIAGLLRDYPKKHVIEITPNRGRDIGPFFSIFGPILLEYDIIGHIHIKASLHAPREMGEAWNQYSFNNLLGHPRHRKGNSIDSIMGRFAENAKTGLIVPEDSLMTSWNGNYYYLRQLARRLGVKRVPRFIFFAMGNMFWLRREVLASFLQFGFSWQDYPQEPLALNGTILHAIEAFGGLATLHSGLNYEGVYLSPS